MSGKPSAIPAVKITLGHLLFIDPTAYVNLCLMFPHGAASMDEIPALVLPANYTLALIGSRKVLLITKTPPAILHFDQKDLEWVPWSPTT